ncbi:MAG: aryl-sulfate sulfotransferase [Pseudomonadota bacterium]
MIARLLAYGVVGFTTVLVSLLVASQVIQPPDIHDFESIDFYKTNAQQTAPGDTSLLLNVVFDQTLGGDLSERSTLEVHVYPNFLPQIRRYGWYPYRAQDLLTITPSWSSDVVSVTVNGRPHPVSEPIKLSAADFGQETSIVAETPDGARKANYVFLTLPHTFPPLKSQVNSPNEVAPGIITGLQATLNNPTFPQMKFLRNLLYTQGLFGTIAQLRKARMRPFDDFTTGEIGVDLDYENRVYLPFVSFALDKFGTPLKYNNMAPRTIFLPITTSRDEGLLPKEGFIFKENVMNSDDNHAEAITRSFISPRGEASKTEIPRHISQFDDGHHIDVTNWETIQNMFYRIHPVGTELDNGDVLDVNVTSTYLVELDRDGNVVWEWDSINHFPPEQAITYLPKDRYHEWDYFHTNGVRFAPGNEELIISARHMRAITNIKYPSGDINWVLADPATPLNQFTYIGDPLGGISTLHAAIMRDDELFVFDNGHYRTPEWSDGSYIYGAPIETRHDYTRVVSYKLDLEAMTANYQREWTYPERLVRTAGYLMFVPNGESGENLLISWGSGGAFTEFSPENRLVMSTDTGGLTYRFYKTNIDHWMN